MYENLSNDEYHDKIMNHLLNLIKYNNHSYVTMFVNMYKCSMYKLQFKHSCILSTTFIIVLICYIIYYYYIYIKSFVGPNFKFFYNH